MSCFQLCILRLLLLALGLLAIGGVGSLQVLHLDLLQVRLKELLAMQPHKALGRLAMLQDFFLGGVSVSACRACGLFHLLSLRAMIIVEPEGYIEQ